MTNVPKPTFGPTGFVAPSQEAILAGVLADLQEAFGGALNESLETPQGQIATSEAAIIGDANDTFLFYTTQTDPAYAEGRMQDAIARIYFLERNPSQPTVVQALCSGLAGVVIVEGALAISVDGNLYTCTQAGEIGVDGAVTLPFSCNVPGPTACPAGALSTIYQAIPGWDGIDNPTAGVVGNDTESRQAFEARRAASVAQNARGSLPAVLGAVQAVSGVLDAYVTENASNAPVTIGGVTLIANSLYVAVVGGDQDDVAQAIWSRKAPGCSYNGNTTVVVVDDSSGYSPPYPSYSVKFETPASLAILFSVGLVSNVFVPSDAETQIQNAIIAAFSGSDGGARARIGSTIYASRYYAPVAALGSWVQITSILVGSNNATSAVFTASIAGTTMTVTAVASGAIDDGDTVSDVAGAITAGTTVVDQLTGTPGGVGTYSVSATQTVTSRTVTAAAAAANTVVVRIDQVPTISAANIKVTLT